MDNAGLTDISQPRRTRRETIGNGQCRVDRHQPTTPNKASFIGRPAAKKTAAAEQSWLSTANTMTMTGSSASFGDSTPKGLSGSGHDRSWHTLESSAANDDGGMTSEHHRNTLSHTSCTSCRTCTRHVHAHACEEQQRNQ
jgi:hypothetical protein